MPLIQLTGSSGRGGCPPVVGESLHPNARNYQVHFEWRRGYCSSSVAHECSWTVSLSCRDPRRQVMSEGKVIRCGEVSSHLNQNRRVELLVPGEAIGDAVDPTPGNLQ